MLGWGSRPWVDIESLKIKKINEIPETMLLSEKSLSVDWNTKEEDEAWADLYKEISSLLVFLFLIFLLPNEDQPWFYQI